MSGTPGRTLGALMLLLPCLVSADEVHLRGGGRVTGLIVERTDRMVVVEAAPGRISLALSRVERIVQGRSALEAFYERSAALDAGDARGWAELARWAEDHDLSTAAREAWGRVIALEPGNREANQALGRLYVDGEWMAEADARRRQGYVPWEGGWVTPAEHEALLRERSAERQSAVELRETELRVREAEARAREAEARAEEAEAALDQGAVDGIPYDWVLYGGGGVALLPGQPCCKPPHSRPPHVRPPQERPPDRPAPPPRPPSEPSSSPNSSRRPGAAVAPARGPVRVPSTGSSRRRD